MLGPYQAVIAKTLAAPRPLGLHENQIFASDLEEQLTSLIARRAGIRCRCPSQQLILKPDLMHPEKISDIRYGRNQP